MDGFDPIHADADTSDSVLARRALRALLSDPNTPAAVMAQAARTLAEMSGLLGRHQDKPSEMDTRPLSALSQEGLKAELARLHGLED